MVSHLGFKWQITKVFGFTVMIILLSYTHRRSDTDVQNGCTCAHSQNGCKTVSYCKIRAGQNQQYCI